VAGGASNFINKEPEVVMGAMLRKSSALVKGKKTARVVTLAAAALAAALFFSATAIGSGTVSKITSSYSWAVTISPDGKHIGYTDDFPWPGQKYSKDLTDGAETVWEGLPSFSHDGRYVAFVADDMGMSRVYREDTLDGTRVLVSSSSAGEPANYHADEPFASWDGRYVAFSSRADNLVAGDTNGRMDVFLKDMLTGALTRLSTDSNGAQGTGGSYNYWDGATTPRISPDNRYVVFTASFTNLVPGDNNGAVDVFLKDTVTGTTVRVSAGASGIEANSSSWDPEISADGHYVAFVSGASNLVPGDVGYYDVFVKDVTTGAIALVSTDASGNQMGYSYSSSLSSDGRHVAFSCPDGICFKNLQTGALETYADNSAGCAWWGCWGPGGWAPAMSADGKRIAFVGSDYNVPYEESQPVFLATTSLCVENSKPELVVTRGAVYWASYQGFADRDLSVDFTITNNGGEPAFSPQVVGSVSTNGVTLNTALPYKTGAIYAGGSADLTLVYEVQMGIASFRTTTYATALDSCGNSHSYPGPFTG